MGEIKCKYKKGKKMIVDVQLSEKSKKITFPSKDTLHSKVCSLSIPDSIVMIQKCLYEIFSKCTTDIETILKYQNLYFSKLKEYESS